MQISGELRAGYDRLPVPVILAEPDGRGAWRACYQNPAAQSLAALDAALLPQLLAGQAAALARTAETGQGRTWDGELCGRLLHVELTGFGGGLCLITAVDATEHRDRASAASAALQSALDAANAASRAKSDFLANMSHDIRTPLNAVIGMTTIARAHLDERERLEDCLNKIDLASRHLLGLINDILDMSRIESGQMTIAAEDFTMASLVHSLMAVFRPQAERKHQQIRLDFSGLRHERVRGDQLRIRQVLINLLSNAVKFTPDEGEISLRIRETGERWKAGGSYAYYEFTVEDNGIGMSRDFLRRVFDPFVRAEGVGRIEGTGLGMTITRNLVEMMNGDIGVQSREGVGSRFTVTLPLEQIDQEEPGLEQLRGRRILAADSDESALASLREIVADLGMEADLCSSSREVAELAAQARLRGDDYFAILLSWHMPVVDGVQTCRELRAMLGKQPPVLIMSSYEWTLTADEMRKFGVSAFVPKPLFRSRLREALCALTPEGLARQAEEVEPERPGFDGKRILLAEDNEINREIAQELIGSMGAQVICAENGREAVELFQSSPEGSFDLIFMDLQMPEMDGFAATRAIRALPRRDSGTVPIVAMTANAFVEDILACERAGMNAHVAKPVSLEQLTETMKTYLS